MARFEGGAHRFIDSDANNNMPEHLAKAGQLEARAGQKEKVLRKDEATEQARLRLHELRKDQLISSLKAAHKELKKTLGRVNDVKVYVDLANEGEKSKEAFVYILKKQVEDGTMDLATSTELVTLINKNEKEKIIKKIDELRKKADADLSEVNKEIKSIDAQIIELNRDSSSVTEKSEVKPVNKQEAKVAPKVNESKPKQSVKTNESLKAKSAKLSDVINGKVNAYSLSSAADMNRYRSKETINGSNAVRANGDRVLLKTALMEISKTELGKELLKSANLDLNKHMDISMSNMVNVIAVYQQIKGLKVDGIFGKNTFASLKKDYGKELYDYSGKEVSTYEMSSEKIKLKNQRKKKKKRVGSVKRKEGLDNAWYSKDADLSKKMYDGLKVYKESVEQKYSLASLNEVRQSIIDRFDHYDQNVQSFVELIPKEEDRKNVIKILEEGELDQNLSSLVKALKNPETAKVNSLKVMINKAMSEEVYTLPQRNPKRLEEIKGVILEAYGMYGGTPDKFVSDIFGDDMLMKEHVKFVLTNTTPNFATEGLVKSLDQELEKDSPIRDKIKSGKDLLGYMVQNGLHLDAKFKDDYRKLYSVINLKDGRFKIFKDVIDHDGGWISNDEFTRDSVKVAEKKLKEIYGDENVLNEVETTSALLGDPEKKGYVYLGMYDGDTFGGGNRVLYVKESAIEKKMIDDIKLKLRNYPVVEEKVKANGTFNPAKSRSATPPTDLH